MQLLDMPSELLLLIGEELSAKDLTAFTTTSRIVHSLLTPRVYHLGAEPSTRFPILHWAAQHGHESLVRGLLAKGASPNGPHSHCDLYGCRGGHKSTALHWATRSDNTRVVKTILENGGDVNARDNHDATPVHWACGNSGVEVLKLLLLEKPDLDAKDGDGDPPIAWAAEKGIPDVFEFMLDHGADIAVVNNSLSTLMHTVFLRAEQHLDSHARIVRMMLDSGFMLIRQQDNNDNMAIHLAARYGSVDAVRIMLDHVGVDTPGNSGQVPLYQAAEMGMVQMVTFLLSKGAKVDLWNGAQQATALHAAAGNGHVEVMEVLIKAGANLEAVKTPMETPLHHAVTGKSVEATRLLLKHGADANAEQLNLKTPLHLASNEPEMVKSLLEHGAKVDARTANGSTPLMMAAEEGCTTAVELLLEFGADVRARDNNGGKAWNRAHDKGNTRTREVLEEWMNIWPDKNGDVPDPQDDISSPTPVWGLENFFAEDSPFDSDTEPEETIPIYADAR